MPSVRLLRNVHSAGARSVLHRGPTIHSRRKSATSDSLQVGVNTVGDVLAEANVAGITPTRASLPTAPEVHPQPVLDDKYKPSSLDKITRGRGGQVLLTLKNDDFLQARRTRSKLHARLSHMWRSILSAWRVVTKLVQRRTGRTACSLVSTVLDRVDRSVDRVACSTRGYGGGSLAYNQMPAVAQSASRHPPQCFKHT